jgi:hypothetical protein
VHSLGRTQSCESGDGHDPPEYEIVAIFTKIWLRTGPTINKALLETARTSDRGGLGDAGIDRRGGLRGIAGTGEITSCAGMRTVVKAPSPFLKGGGSLRRVAQWRQNRLGILHNPEPKVLGEMFQQDAMLYL